VCYTNENPPSPAEYAQALKDKLGTRNLEIIMEPGRAIAANAGILVTRVIDLKPTKHKNFAIVDAAMNDLMRPALYQAWHDIIPVDIREGNTIDYDIVGPICETGDFLGKDHNLNLQANDLLAVRTAGAYGFTMSSNYNSRPRSAEIMADGSNTHLIRQRETIESLFANESPLP
jgi:diaminopimelate decarboxylase